MRAYKGFNKKLQCTRGRNTFTYEQGKTYQEPSSKTASSGFHCAEYLPDCFKFYPPDGKNRFFVVEAGGSIDEESSDSKIACTEITLIKELSRKQMAIACMIYMVKHPKRDWETSGHGYCIGKNKAETSGGIAIARGAEPQTKGGKGSIIGLILEKDGQIIQAKAEEVDGALIRPDTWYTITRGGRICEIQSN